ncbi:hypothetical protein HY503_00865 [Candidatus Woesebacteria bacterium]|nr:hypothetical protein [Candidatus Woesebacteria bacterium]
MRKFFNWFSSAFAILFAIPSFLILISWNALPGDSLYGVKTGLEDIALATTIRTPLASAFSLNFTERRFSEANRLLAKSGSTLGYTLLVAEAKETQTIIVDQKDSKKAEELVTKIEEYQKNIEEKKLALSTEPSAIIPQASPAFGTQESGQACIQVITPAKNPATGECSEFPTPCDVPTGWVQVSSCVGGEVPEKTTIPSPTPASSVEVVIEDLEQTNQELEEIKEEIKIQLPPQASEKAKENLEEHRDREKPSKYKPNE